MGKAWKTSWTKNGQRITKSAGKEHKMTKARSMDSLLARAEELDFRRDLMEYTQESFSGVRSSTCCMSKE